MLLIFVQDRWLATIESKLLTKYSILWKSDINAGCMIFVIKIGRKVINKESYSDIEIMKIIIFANMACAYLNVRKLQKCNKFA